MSNREIKNKKTAEYFKAEATKNKSDLAFGLSFNKDRSMYYFFSENDIVPNQTIVECLEHVLVQLRQKERDLIQRQIKYN